MGWNPYSAERVTLHTPLTPDECIQRIQASIRSFLRDGDSDAPFFGSVTGYTFTVFKGKLFDGSATRSVAEGEVASDGGGGATITIRLPLHVTGGAIALVAYGLAVVFIVSQTLAMFNLDSALTIPLTILFSVLLVAAGVYCYGFIASLFTDDQRDFLITTLRKRLDASVVKSTT